MISATGRIPAIADPTAEVRVVAYDLKETLAGADVPTAQAGRPLVDPGYAADRRLRCIGTGR